jgi:uncharacterized protein with GYD domain
MMQKPYDTLDAVRPPIEKLQGRVIGGWFAFGEYDLITILELPDNTSAAAISMAVAASGAIRCIKTTALMTVQEGIRAMKLAAEAGFGVGEPD